MKIVVFGSTGRVGHHVVRRAVEAGHTVTAFLRTPSKLETHEGVTVVEGDAFDRDAVAQAIEGHDAVISCLASSAGLKASTEVSRMVHNIVRGMAAANIDRLAYCASLGVDNELTGVVGKGISWVLRHPLADHRAALAHVKAANLNFTIARPTSLSNAPFEPDYQEASIGMPAGNRPIPRASVAHFLVKSLEQPDVYSRTSVGLALGKR